jgi:hypothetical protein
MPVVAPDAAEAAGAAFLAGGSPAASGPLSRRLLPRVFSLFSCAMTSMDDTIDPSVKRSAASTRLDRSHGSSARTVSVSGPSHGGCGILLLIAAEPTEELQSLRGVPCGSITRGVF